MEFELGTCRIVDNWDINQKKCEILKRFITHRIYNNPKDVIDTWKYFDYEFGLNKQTDTIESLVIFNGFSNELDYFYFSPIPIEIVKGEYTGIEDFIGDIHPYIQNDLNENED